MVKPLKARLDFFEHLFRPDACPRGQKPMCGLGKPLGRGSLRRP